jgi:hypothetical protein
MSVALKADRPPATPTVLPQSNLEERSARVTPHEKAAIILCGILLRVCGKIREWPPPGLPRWRACLGIRPETSRSLATTGLAPWGDVWRDALYPCAVPTGQPFP